MSKKLFKTMDAYVVLRRVWHEGDGSYDGRPNAPRQWYMESGISMDEADAQKRVGYLGTEARYVRVRIRIPKDIRGSLIP